MGFWYKLSLSASIINLQTLAILMKILGAIFRHDFRFQLPLTYIKNNLMRILFIQPAIVLVY